MSNESSTINAAMTSDERAHWLERLFDQALDHALLMIDPEGHIAMWTAGAQNVFGYASPEILGERFDVLFTEEDRTAKIAADELASARRTGRAHDDRWHRRKDGSRFWASGAVVAMRNGDGSLQGFAKFIRDRTELRTHMEALNHRLLTELQECARRDAFLTTVAHEIRSPLAPLSNALELIRVAAGDADSRFHYAVGVIERQVHLIKRLADDLMDTERVRQGKMKLTFKSVKLNEVLAEAIESIRPAAQQKSLQIECALPTVPVEIDLDAERFIQIMRNLLGNAVKYTPAGGNIWINVIEGTGYATIRVEDTGVGIPADLQPRLFDLFTQGGNVDQTRRDSGLGIGLSLVKHWSRCITEPLGFAAKGQARVASSPCGCRCASPAL